MQVLFELGTRDGMTFMLHVSLETRDDPLRPDELSLQAKPQVEQIAAFPPLVQRPQLRAHQLVEMVCADPRLAREPGVRDRQRKLLKTLEGEMLPRIDLNLRRNGRTGGISESNR